MLVVDDEETILLALRDYFATIGYDVDCAREEEEAQALLANIRYSAVIADLRLTGINGAEGLQVIKYVRACCPDTHVILLTAYGHPEVEAEANRLGADAVLQKPLPLQSLASILNTLIEGSA
jgi:DNA-binding response OmpR family regulator